jgi:hypothetical protein
MRLSPKSQWVGLGAPGSQWQGSGHESHKLCQSRVAPRETSQSNAGFASEKQPGSGALSRAMQQVSVRSALVHFVIARRAPMRRLII